MNAPSPDHPAHHPDQGSTEAWQATAEARDHAEIRTRDAEEAHAKANSRPTKILGFLILGGVLMQFIAAISKQNINLGGPFSLLAGIMILRGSQAWVRFVGFIGCMIALICVFQLIVAQMFRQPVETWSGWRSFSDFRLWVEYVSPAVFMSAAAILAFAVLRHRQLPYWTKAIKVSSTVTSIVIVTTAIAAFIRELRNEELCRRFPAEIKEAELHATSSLGTMSPGKFPALYSLTAFSTPDSSTSYQVRTSSLPPGQIRKAFHFMKLPSGEWRKLELELIVSDLS